MKLGELAKKLGAELRGDAELEVTGVKGIEEAGPTEVTFVANPKYGGLARKTKAAAVLVEPEFPEIERRLCGSRTLTTPFRARWAFSISRRFTRREFIRRR
jgi:UDP-3-O-[3-hydroxymyristoyl] glucosamine N-acyltransferase